MSRQFGTRSFQPESIYFGASGNQPSGLPWKAVERKIPVNILCEANNNPCTVEELSMEMGIAMPYMEEEVALLEQAELLHRLDNGKYITGFFISPRECQNEVNELTCQFAEKHYRDIWDLAERVLEKSREAGCLNEAVSLMDAQAFFAFFIEQQVENTVLPPGIFSKFKRKDGGNWGFIGKENGAFCRLPSTFFNNNWSCASLTEPTPIQLQWDIYWSSNCAGSEYGNNPYKECTPWREEQLVMLKRIAEGSDTADFTDSDRLMLEKMLEKGFCVKKEDGSILVAALVFRKGILDKITEYLSALPEYGQLKKEMQNYTECIREIIARYSVPYLKEDFDYYVAMSINLRSVFSMLWKDKGLYTGGNAQFAAFSYT